MGTNPPKLRVHSVCDGDKNLSSTFSLNVNDPLPVQLDYPKGLITPPNVSFLFNVGDSNLIFNTHLAGSSHA
ncbi:hypothetical protein JTE90_028982 [Oedothorax gibbosus]|uniref:Laccase n=1 Tax=Oedothorax gibbosus TaxID=931172 RepID=A0AAV6VHJ7_9ARAC|nr:hypothetical protein JTE90_028982 [Oedothorax gibbosus]